MSRAGSVAIIVLAVLSTRCGSSTGASTTSSSSSSVETVVLAASTPSMYDAFYGATVARSGSEVVIHATSVPDHPSPYFDTADSRYEAPSAGMRVNPNRIQSQSLVFHVPASPTVTSPSDTPMGPIGVAVNGVAFFNQYAAGRSPLDAEIPTFDRYNGHPQVNGLYHYHLEPLWLTARGQSRLLGVLLDGFPVYGTRDSGGAIPSDLDVCNGHVSPTAEFPVGIYHYHVTANSPYIAGCFHGQPGRIG